MRMLIDLVKNAVIRGGGGNPFGYFAYWLVMTSFKTLLFCFVLMLSSVAYADSIESVNANLDTSPYFVRLSMTGNTISDKDTSATNDKSIDSKIIESVNANLDASPLLTQRLSMTKVTFGLA